MAPRGTRHSLPTAKTAPKGAPKFCCGPNGCRFPDEVGIEKRHTSAFQSHYHDRGATRDFPHSYAWPPQPPAGEKVSSDLVGHGRPGSRPENLLGIGQPLTVRVVAQIKAPFATWHTSDRSCAAGPMGIPAPQKVAVVNKA
ncbi:hypothetical protein GCM10010411_74270 [Actinomadura fulvescens]|uniref:Uncharacterized protein n=1 Tax=Actinomadura fulvescens TaxID=46160 RepID=A0ABP6CY42_9ACTN